jgi:hypothetical protein
VFTLEGENDVYSQCIKSNHRVLIKNSVDGCGAPAFSPDNCATILGAKIYII